MPAVERKGQWLSDQDSQVLWIEKIPQAHYQWIQLMIQPYMWKQMTDWFIRVIAYSFKQLKPALFTILQNCIYELFMYISVSTFGEKEVLHISPPQCSCREGSGTNLCDSAPCDAIVTADTSRDSQTMRTSNRLRDLRTAYSDKYQSLESEQQDDHKLEKLQTFFSEKGTSPRTHLESRAGQRFKDLLLAIEEKTYNARHTEPLVQTSPLPRLRHTGTLKESTPRKVTWVGLTRHATAGTGSSPFFVNGSKPPLFPSQRQQALVIKNLRHAKEKRSAGGAGIGVNAAKRNSVQLRAAIQQRRATDLNLPMLPSALQNKSDKKTEILRMDFGWQRFREEVKEGKKVWRWQSQFEGFLEWLNQIDFFQHCVSLICFLSDPRVKLTGHL